MYSFTSRLSHWAGAALMATAFLLVWLREDLQNSDLRSVMLEFHQWVGLLVLLLLLPRLLARRLGTAPRHVMPKWQRLLASGTETSLYLLMIVQPLIGWLMVNLKGDSISLLGLPLPVLADPDRGVAKQLGELHETGGTLILILVGLHIFAALYHHFWRRDRVLAAMLGSDASRVG